jgi:hypothetical protein
MIDSIEDESSSDHEGVLDMAIDAGAVPRSKYCKSKSMVHDQPTIARRPSATKRWLPFNSFQVGDGFEQSELSRGPANPKRQAQHRTAAVTSHHVHGPLILVTSPPIPVLQQVVPTISRLDIGSKAEYSHVRQARPLKQRRQTTEAVVRSQLLSLTAPFRDHDASDEADSDGGGSLASEGIEIDSMDVRDTVLAEQHDMSAPSTMPKPVNEDSLIRPGQLVRKLSFGRWMQIDEEIAEDASDLFEWSSSAVTWLQTSMTAANVS